MAFGSRQGSTAVFGSLTPTQTGTVSRLFASIMATPPLGMITTTCSWGFMAGAAPPGTTTLTVVATGTTVERATTSTWGGYASAAADISITVDAFVDRNVSLSPRIPPDIGVILVPVPNIRVAPDLAFAGSVTSGPTPIINLENWGVGFQLRERNMGTATVALVMPIIPGRFYQWQIESVQSAACQGGLFGGSSAVCNFTFDFGPVFFAFT